MSRFTITWMASALERTTRRIAAPLWRWVAAGAVVAVLTALLQLASVGASVCGMLYLAVVVWTATLAGAWLSLSVAIASAFLFDYYFLEPFHSFTIAEPRDWITMAAYVGCCVIVSRVAERARSQAIHAQQRREDVERLNLLSQEMMLYQDASSLIRDMPRLVQTTFALEAVLLYLREAIEPADTNPLRVAGGFSAEDHLYSSVPEIPADIRGMLSTLVPAAEAITALPGGFVSINLVFGMKDAGVLAWKPASITSQVASAIAAQVSIAVARAHAIDAAARIEAARAGDRLRSALIDSLTHELRTPLTAIRAAATTLVDGRCLDSETREELAAILDEESARLDSLIGDALEMAQIEADAIRVKPVPLHSQAVLEQAVEQSRDLLRRHRVHLEVEPPDDPIWLDPQLLGRVLRHLLENAVRYSPPGTRILLRSRRLAGYLEITVQDQGPGIDAFDLPMIFEKFYRGRNRPTAVKGSGMGLAIARSLLAAHGGEINAENVADGGAAFHVRIPLKERTPSALDF